MRAPNNNSYLGQLLWIPISNAMDALAGLDSLVYLRRWYIIAPVARNHNTWSYWDIPETNKVLSLLWHIIWQTYWLHDWRKKIVITSTNFPLVIYLFSNPFILIRINQSKNEVDSTSKQNILVEIIYATKGIVVKMSGQYCIGGHGNNISSGYYGEKNIVGRIYIQVDTA